MKGVYGPVRRSGHPTKEDKPLQPSRASKHSTFVNVLPVDVRGPSAQLFISEDNIRKMAKGTMPISAKTATFMRDLLIMRKIADGKPITRADREYAKRRLAAGVDPEQPEFDPFADWDGWQADKGGADK